MLILKLLLLLPLLFAFVFKLLNLFYFTLDFLCLSKHWAMVLLFYLGENGEMLAIIVRDERAYI